MQPSRSLAAALEPFAGQVYFSPECHRAYEALGFAPSPGAAGAVALPDGPAYFTSRGSLMGQVHGEVVAAAFGVFNPAVVVPAVAHGWSLTDAATICRARTEGAGAQLERLLGGHPPGIERAIELLARAVDDLRPEGKPLFAGVVAQGETGEALVDAWRLADALRDYRGDVHLNVWTTAGFDGAEIGLVTELYWGLPMRTYVRTRAWSPDDLDAATERLEARGLVDGGQLTPAGREARERIETETDAGCAPIVARLGDELEEVVAVLSEWSRAIQAGGGYPAQGPHDLARLGERRR
ncbi:MAG TPA: hypothetical protein VKU92_12460 [Acidimicrobiales bacterium]|nr:hypothetical protein [Acidimicrobiales bacterium]